LIQNKIQTKIFLLATLWQVLWVSAENKLWCLISKSWSLHPNTLFTVISLTKPKTLKEKSPTFLLNLTERGLPYDKVSYFSLLQEALRECSTSQHINSITLSVKDQSGELFDFKGLPLEFVLQLN